MALKDDVAEALIGKDRCLRCDACDSLIIIEDSGAAPAWWQVWTTSDDDGESTPVYDCCSEECANDMRQGSDFIIPPDLK